MKAIEQELLRQMGFSDAFKGDSVGNYPGNEVLTVVDETYSLTFNGKSFYQVIKLMVAGREINAEPISFVYAGYEILVSQDENNVIMAEVFDSEEYRGEHKDEPDMAQFIKKPLMNALNWIEQRLAEVAKLENIDDLPFPKTIEVESGDIKEALKQLRIFNIGDKYQFVQRLQKALES